MTDAEAEHSMKLPDGKTCADCAHVYRCTIFGFTDNASNTVCDFAPKAKPLVMPERQPFDGPISVRRVGESFIIEATQGGLTTRVEMSEYNAWRTFGCLALFLEIPLPSHVSKAIDLSDGKGNPPKATVCYPEPKTLGERLAQNLTMNELVRRGIVAEVEPEARALESRRKSRKA